MKIAITLDTKGTPPGKVAEAELHFTEGVLAGCKLIGFGVWESRGAQKSLNVTFPSRQYSVNGERRSFSLLRPANGDATAQDGIRDAITAAYQTAVEEASAAEDVKTKATA